MRIRSFIASFVAVAMVLSLAGIASPSQAAGLTSSQVQAILSLLTSFGADQATLNNVNAALNGQATSGTTVGGTCSYTFTKDLDAGISDPEAMQLQKFLNSNGFVIAASGAGSVGSETNYFGSLTTAALAKFQAANGISPAVGYFGPITRAKVNAMCTTTGGNTGGNGGTTTGGGVTTGSSVAVSLAASQPSSTLVSGQAIGEVARYTFTNQTSSAANITNVVLNRIGVSNDSSLGDVYLYDGSIRLTDAAGISSGVVTFNQPSGLFTVPAGSSRTISVRANIAASTSGQTVGFALNSALANIAVTGLLPVSGNVLSIADANLATVDLNTSTSPSSSSITAQADYTVWQNTVTIGTRAVDLKAVTFRMGGSVSASDIQNFRLYVDGTQVGSAVSMVDANRYLTIDLSNSPVRLETGGRVIKVVADIVAGASRTFQMQLRQASDILAVDSQLGQPVLSTKNGSTFAVAQATEATISAGSVSVNKSTSSPTSNVTVGGTNVKFASFDFRASGEDVKIENLNVFASTTVALAGLNDGKVFVNGVQVGSTKDLTEATAVNFTFGSSFIVKAGTTATVDIYADAKKADGTSFSDGAQARISLTASTANGSGQSSLTSVTAPGSTVDGNWVTLSSSSLSVTKYSGYGAQTIVAGVNGARLGSLVMSAGSSEGVAVNTITIQLDATASAEADKISNLMLKDNATGAQIGVTKTTPSSGANSFAVNFTVPASGTKVIDVYGDVLSGAANGNFIAGVGADGTGSVTGTSASQAVVDNNLQTITIGSGSLSLAVGAGDPVSTNVIAGSSSVKVGQFRFSAANSSYTIQDLVVKVPNGAATSVGQLTLSYKDSAGVTKTASQALTVGTEVYATATFKGLSLYVPKDDEATLDVFVSIPSIASGAVSGAGISVVLDNNEEFKAISDSGASSTSVGSADVSSNGVFYVRKSIPTFAKQTLSSTAPITGSPLYTFTVSADSAGAVEWKELDFTVATSNVAVSDFYLQDSSKQTPVNTAVAQPNGGVVKIYAGAIGTNGGTGADTVEQIAAGTSKTYNLYGTVTGWGTNGESEQVSISFTEDSLGSTLGGAAQISASNIVWSDRAGTSHTTATSDWINGYLLRDLTNDTQTFSR